MTDKKAKNVIDALNVIRDNWTKACRKANADTEVFTRASLATSAFNLASHVKPAVLQEIYELSVAASNHNLPALDEVSEKSISGIKRNTMEMLANNIISHIDRETVDPKLKRCKL